MSQEQLTIDKIVTTKLMDNAVSIAERMIEQFSISKKEIDDYKYYIEEEKFLPPDSETIEKNIERHDSIIDRVEEIEKKMKSYIENSQKMIEELRKTTAAFEEIVNNKSNDDEKIKQFKNKIVDERNELIEKMYIPQLEELDEKRREIEETIIKRKKEMEERRIETSNEKKQRLQRELELDIQKVNKEIVESKRKPYLISGIDKDEELFFSVHDELKGLMTFEECRQLEEWSGLNTGYICFDSNIHSWSQNTSLFAGSLLNRKNVAIIISDNSGNKFGGFISERITRTDRWIDDKKAFLFSLQNGNRLGGMKKIDIKRNSSNYAFEVFSNNNSYLCFFGSQDIYVYKSNSNGSHSFSQSHYEYNGLNYPFTGGSSFYINRILVIQFE